MRRTSEANIKIVHHRMKSKPKLDDQNPDYFSRSNL